MAGGIRIPLYQLPQEQQRALPETYQQSRATAADFGADIGRGLAQAGEQLGRIALRQAAEDNEAAARDIDNRFADDLRTTLYDPERGYYATRGRAALDGRTTAQSAVEALRKTYGSMATNPDQQRMVAAVLDRRMQAALLGITEHALQQGGAWRAGTRKARIDGAIADGATAWRDPAAVRLSFNTGREEVRAQVATAGGGPRELAMALQRYDTDFHTALIERRLAQDPPAARPYFDQVRGTIAPAAAVRLDARLREADADRRAVMLAASYSPAAASPSGEPGPGPEPQPAAYEAQAQQDAGGDDAQLARNRAALQARFRRDHAAWRERRASGIQAGYDWLDANPGEPVVAMPPQIRDGMDRPTLAKLAAYADQGGNVATDWRRYQTLQRFALADPAAFTEYDLNEERWTLASPQLDALRKLQDQMRRGDPDHARTYLRQATETVDDYLQAAGVAPDAAAAVALRRQFQDELAAFEHDKARRAEPAEMQAMLDRLALRRSTAGV